MSWQSIALGSNGVFFYSIYDLAKDKHFTQPQGWARLSAVAQEIQRFALVLLARRAASGGVVLVAVAGTLPPPSWLLLRRHWGVGANSTNCFAFAVNDGSGSGQVTLGVTDATGRKLSAVTVVNEQPERVVTDWPSSSSFRFAMAPLDVMVLRVQFHSAVGIKSEDMGA
jgi:hypothetical protein